MGSKVQFRAGSGLFEGLGEFPELKISGLVLIPFQCSRFLTLKVLILAFTGWLIPQVFFNPLPRFSQAFFQGSELPLETPLSSLVLYRLSEVAKCLYLGRVFKKPKGFGRFVPQFFLTWVLILPEGNFYKRFFCRNVHILCLTVVFKGFFL